MPVHAFIVTVWARPKPPILAILNCINEVFADLVSGRFGIAVL
jgi:hypothetical protein